MCNHSSLPSNGMASSRMICSSPDHLSCRAEGFALYEHVRGRVRYVLVLCVMVAAAVFLPASIDGGTAYATTGWQNGEVSPHPVEQSARLDPLREVPDRSVSQATDEPAQQTRAGQPIIIRWTTESEVGTAGYNIYRAESEDGPWTKINERLIPGATDPLRGGSYVYTDTQVLAGQTYWYELEEIELNGSANRLQRTTAVAQPERSGPSLALPCAGALLLAPTFAVVALARGKGLGQRRILNVGSTSSRLAD